MSAFERENRVALGLLLASVFIACSASPAEEDTAASSGQIPVVGNYPSASAGSKAASTSDGFKGWGPSASAGSSGAAGIAAGAAGMGAAGSAGAAAGSGTAGTAGTAAAGAGGSASADMSATSDDPLDLFGSGAGGASAPGSDPIADLFGPGASGAPAPSCEGLVCLEDADCQNLYPEEHAQCKFTGCVDLVCK